MKNLHLFSDQYYLISNASAARNSLFETRDDCIIFRNKIEEYLAPISEIFSYHFGTDEYLLLIKLKSKEEVEQFYIKKTGKQEEEKGYIPPTTYIFSQQMANLQSGYAKGYNYRNNRFGSLFTTRFQRVLIKTPEELETWKEVIHEMGEFRPRSRYWRSDRYEAIRRSGMKLNEDLVYNSKRMYEEGCENGFAGFIFLDIEYARGYFKKTLKKYLSTSEVAKFFQNSLKVLFNLS